MRDIKFRVWNVKSKKFNTIPQQHIDLNRCAHLCMKTEQDTFCVYILASTENRIFQQYTGLKDKSGKEIFEGDIIQYCGECDLTYKLPGIVDMGEYFTHAGGFYHYGVRVKRLDMENSYFGLRDNLPNYIIIGNIFETPELISNG